MVLFVVRSRSAVHFWRNIASNTRVEILLAKIMNVVEILLVELRVDIVESFI